jgi:serine/threonine-protein kinase HipA
MTMENEKREVFVYADWDGLAGTMLMGKLLVNRTRGKEIFAFEYDSEWMNSGFNMYLDPNLGLFKGQQYLPDDKPNFGMFLDSSPDRWGRLLMRRREAAMSRKEGRKENTLYETDYLLGVFDEHRMGGIRFKTDPDGDFLNNQKEMASPPWTSLRELENASLNLERVDAASDPEYLKWLAMLIAPGSSLGGARPKAGVLDEKNRLWIAKFPSVNDEQDVGAWEMVLHHLAEACGIIVPEARLLQFGSKYHTFLTKRFDRNNDGRRIHFASAMTLLGYNDGSSHEDGASYLEMVEIIQRYGAEPQQDLEQLWRRILFNVCVSNTDDHLRNHGFLLTERGWRLSPAYDMNPNETGTGLKLNISENDNSLSIDLVMSVAGYFKLDETKSKTILNEMQRMISKWNEVAKNMGISNEECRRMSRVFNK